MGRFEFETDNPGLMVMLHGGGPCDCGAIPGGKRRGFPDMGHDAVTREHPTEFSKKVQATHRRTWGR